MPEGRRPNRSPGVRVVRSDAARGATAVVDNMSLFSAGSWSVPEVVTDPFWLTTWRSLIDSVLHARRVTYFEPNPRAREAYVEPPARQMLTAAGLLTVLPGRHRTEDLPIGERELTRQADYAVRVLTDGPSLRVVSSAYRWLASCRRGDVRDLADTEPANEEFEEYWSRELRERVEESLVGGSTTPEQVKALMRLSVRGTQYQQLVERHLIDSYYIDHPMRRRSASVEAGAVEEEFLLDWSPLLHIRFVELQIEWPRIAKILAGLRPRIREAGLHPDDRPFESLEIGEIRQRCREVAYRSGLPLEWDELERRKVLRLLKRESDVFHSTALSAFFDIVGSTIPGLPLAATLARSLAQGLVTTRIGWWLGKRVDEALGRVENVPPGLGSFGARLVRQDYFASIRIPRQQQSD